MYEPVYQLYMHEYLILASNLFLVYLMMETMEQKVTVWMSLMIYYHSLLYISFYI